MQNQELIKSPLNYTGGKFKLLPQILPLFPKKINIFYDIFCGGANISVNVNSKKIIATDINKKIINLYDYFLKNSYSNIINEIYDIINKYELSNTQKNGYEYYNCNSSDGLGNYNKQSYTNLKNDYNENIFSNYNENILFYILIIFGFNNQIRFNRKNKFNIPVGKRDFNKNININFMKFHERINNINISFNCEDFSKINIEDDVDNFVYADPPYLITNATYNELDGWNEKKETELLNFLNTLDKNNIKFALSNVLENKNRKNNILEEWINNNKYYVHELNFSYENSSYQNKNKNTKTREVLITNYINP